MKRIIFCLLFGISLICTSITVFASDDDNMLSRAESIFPRTFISRGFSDGNSFTWPSDHGITHSWDYMEPGGVRACAVENADDSRYFPCFEAGGNYYGSLENFWLKIEIMPKSISGGEHCFVRYNTPDEKSAVYITPGDDVSKIDKSRNSNDWTTYEDLTYDDPSSDYWMDVIRYSGKTYIYIDNSFVTSFNDGISGRVAWNFGIVTSGSGSSGTCYFDNLFVYRQ